MNPRERKRPWEVRLQAPIQAVEYYRALEKAFKSGAFDVCHIYEGNSLPFVPVKPPQLCDTLGCINPRHWSSQKLLVERFANLKDRYDSKFPEPDLSDLEEIVCYYMENEPYPPRTFEALRPLISEEDISDAQLRKLTRNHGN